MNLKKIVELACEAVQISSDSWWSFGNSNYVSSRSHMPCSAASSLSKLGFGCRSDKIIDTRRPPRRVCATRCMHCSSATKLALIYRITSTNVRQSPWTSRSRTRQRRRRLAAVRNIAERATWSGAASLRLGRVLCRSSTRSSKVETASVNAVRSGPDAHPIFSSCPPALDEHTHTHTHTH